MCAILPAVHAFQDRLIGHTLELMSDNTSVVAYINKQGGTIRSALYVLARQVLAWAESSVVTIVAHYILDPQNVIENQLSCPGQVIGMGVVSPCPSGSESLPIIGDTGNRLVCVSYEQEASGALFPFS